MKVHSLLLLAIMAAVLLLLIVHQCQAIGLISPRHLLKSGIKKNGFLSSNRGK